ncbi:hypothetical protein KY339_00485 [Candidatus Woesearchaeota archaeon]|nr:hypothetical protein [Candidatus Woesearchaeota archaeon]
MVFEHLRKVLLNNEEATVWLDENPIWRVQDMLEKIFKTPLEAVVRPNGRIVFKSYIEGHGESYSDEKIPSPKRIHCLNEDIKPPENFETEEQYDEYLSDVARRILTYSNEEKMKKQKEKKVVGESYLEKIVIPSFKQFTAEESSALARLLCSLEPTFKPNFKKITDETSAVLVGNSNGLIFKIYNSEDIVKKEATILRSLASTPSLKRRCQVLARSLDDPNLENRIKKAQFSDKELLQILKNRQDGYLVLGGNYIIVTENEAPSLDEENPFFSHRVIREDQKLIDVDNLEFEKALEKEGVFHWFQALMPLSKEILGQDFHDSEEFLAFSFVSDNKIIRRLYILSRLHSDFTEKIKEENTEIVPEQYHDFILPDLKPEVDGKLPKYLLQTYFEASERQRNMYKWRNVQGELVFTHGDAKWDNWFGGVLGDFGSAKFSTEYKDIAKSLLDSAHITHTEVIDDYINSYFRMRELIGDEVLESPAQFKMNVYDAILTESIRTIYYKSPIPEKKELVDHLVKIAEHYAKIISETRK